MKRQTIKSRLITHYFIVSLFPILFLVWFILNKTESYLINTAFSKLEAVETLKINEVMEFFKEFQNSAILLSKLPFIKNHLENYPNAQLSVSSQNYLSEFVKQNEFYDLFIFTSDSGKIIYSVAKEADLGLHMDIEDSHLADTWRKMDSQQKVEFSDLLPYSYSFHKPALFVVTPVFSSNEDYIGAVGLQLPYEKINSVIREREGLEKSSETYLVGQDFRMRSDSFLDSINHSVFASFNGSVEKNGVNTQASKEALKGKSGKGIIEDYRGVNVLSVWRSLEFNNMRWAIISEVDYDEVLNSTIELKRVIILLVFFMLIIIIYLSLWMASSLSQQVKKLTSASDKIIDGIFDNSIENCSIKELNELSDSFRRVSEELNRVIESADNISVSLNNDQNPEIIKEEQFSGRWKILVRSINHLINSKEKSEQKRLETKELLEKAMHLATIGGFSSGIAHEINQPLNVLKMSIDGIIFMMDNKINISEDKLIEKYRSISTQCQKVSDIVYNIRNLSYTKERLKITTFFPLKSIEDIIMSLGKNYIKLETDNRTCSLLSNKVIFEQIIMNLVKNSIETINKMNNPEIIISLKKSKNLVVDIRDNGSGIPETIRHKIYEPFVSSSSGSDNMGLGLFIVKNLVNRLSGQISFETSAKGTKFAIILPDLMEV
ncbi:MAG: sensor histidine kinase [Candidatus Delongbacteria bacterium]|nr:sensor histidine kinase [Candidatus Delongbacteria bacterium]MBN2836668.1 sensor histidine kinase [Candidatus Delongbacteria bacterium]